MAPVKLVPLTTTGVPTPPLSGETPVIVGATYTVSAVALDVKPPPFTMVISPLVASAGTIAVILVAELTVKKAPDEPLKVTRSVLMKFTPLMITLVPAAALDGAKLVIRGPDGVAPRARRGAAGRREGQRARRGARPARSR